MISNATEKYVLNSKRRRIEGKWYWQIDLYYPREGTVKTVMAPEEDKVIFLDALHQ